MNTDLVRRLAVSQARGVRQISFVNELLSLNEIQSRAVYVLGGATQTLTYGASDLSRASWVNLKARLVSVGFVVPERRRFNNGLFVGTTVRLTFPEAGIV